MTGVPSVRAVTRLTAVYGALLRAELRVAAAHRAQLILGFFSWTVPFAFLALWLGAAGSGSVDGIGRGQFVTYFSVLLISNGLQVLLPLVFRISPLVHSGRLSALLLQPQHPLHAVLARDLAEKVYRLTPLVLVVPITVGILGGTVSTVGTDWPLAALVCLLGTVSLGYVGALAGSVALWITNSAGLRGLVGGVEWLLGGLVAPVSLLPGPLPSIARHLPFWFADGAPAEIISGIHRPSAWVLVEAAAWIVVLDRGFRLVWMRGIRRYESVGS